MSLEKLKIWCSPVTGTIYAGYEKNGAATQKVEVTKQVVDAVIQHMDVTNRDYECVAGELMFKKNTVDMNTSINNEGEV